MFKSTFYARGSNCLRVGEAHTVILLKTVYKLRSYLTLVYTGCIMYHSRGHEKWREPDDHAIDIVAVRQSKQVNFYSGL